MGCHLNKYHQQMCDGNGLGMVEVMVDGCSGWMGWENLCVYSHSPSHYQMFTSTPFLSASPQYPTHALVDTVTVAIPVTITGTCLQFT